MSKPKTNVLYDSWVMFKRCLLIAMRNPEALAMATITPFALMFLFGTVFGSIANVGDFNYIDFIVPGIILQSVAQAAQYSAINVTTDMTKGIIDRFRSMPISKSAVLTGHTGAGVARNTITTTVIIGTAFIIGFRPQAGFMDWLMIVGFLLLIIIAMSLIAVLCGLISKTPEGTSGLMFPLFILPFVSSGFAPTETMPRGLSWFAENQPMTPIIDTIRNLMLGLPADNSLWIALAWCVGIIVAAFVAAAQIYRRKLQ
ncbi:MAG: ABC transporter permease [Oscillospiraceae bacterium]|jgi:ABC-2 type transport system permease protein|nr:ABC transporter permease [Oscillospiraceae bacterium]